MDGDGFGGGYGGGLGLGDGLRILWVVYLRRGCLLRVGIASLLKPIFQADQPIIRLVLDQVGTSVVESAFRQSKI
jgi:hypothetical protein